MSVDIGISSVCTSNRHLAFVSDDAVGSVRRKIFNAASACDFVVFAYVFMPDHLHLLVAGTSTSSNLRRFASLAKQRSGFDHAQREHRRLWQPSYHDHVLREGESTLSFVYYMFQNPVRAGLAERWMDYPYLGSGIMTLLEIEDALKEAGAASWSG